jgi:hypothetical protein
MTNAYKIVLVKHEEKYNFGEEGRVILKWILRKEHMRV